MAFLLAILYLILRHLLCVSADIYCKDEHNNNVDWFVLYKFPPIKTNPISKLFKKGSGYMFITSNTLKEGWIISQKPIGANDSLLGNSVSFLYQQPQNMLWITYNDQGDKNCETCGHTKGIVGGDKRGGLWLIHSVPHLPVMQNIQHKKKRKNGTSSYYPSSGYKNGQSALCISLSPQQLDSIGKLLEYNQPKIRNHSSLNLVSLYPKLISVLKGERIVQPPWNTKQTLKTKENELFVAFAKAKSFHKDLYEWLSEDFNSSIYAETWLNEGGALPAFCNATNKVMNIRSIKYKIKNTAFPSSKDHSKWAITESVSNPWVCIGDINRAVPQKKRGGGTICLKSKQLWNHYNNLINSTDLCSLSKYLHSL